MFAAESGERDALDSVGTCYGVFEVVKGVKGAVVCDMVSCCGGFDHLS